MKNLVGLIVGLSDQKVIGNYIVDFYCHAARLVIEVDGGQHYEKEGLENDAIRNADLKGLGLRRR